MHIEVQDAQAWLDSVKAQITVLDPTLEQYLSGYALGRLMDTFDDPSFGVATWTDFSSTPLLVKQAIAMFYAAWHYDKQYSEVAAPGTGTGPSGTPYGDLLRTSAEQLLEGIISGSILLEEIQPNSPEVLPEFYPTDTSSTTEAKLTNTDPDDNSLGPAMFGVAKVF